MGRLRNIGRLRAGGQTNAWTPAQISFTSGLWLDQSDLTTGFQDSAGTTPITASGQFVGKRSDKSGLGNHVFQAGSTARPEWDILSGIDSDFTDGLNDGYATNTFLAGTMVNGMDCFMTLKRATTSAMAPVSLASGSSAFGVMDGTASLACVGTGTAWSFFVDGVQVGGVNTTTRTALSTAMGSGAYHVLEVHDLDLSTWTQLTIGLYSAFFLNADMAQFVLCPSQSSANRAKLRTYCGAKGGLTL